MHFSPGVLFAIDCAVCWYCYIHTRHILTWGWLVVVVVVVVVKTGSESMDLWCVVGFLFYFTFFQSLGCAGFGFGIGIIGDGWMDSPDRERVLTACMRCTIHFAYLRID
ncbi:hypothetical protein QBC39DRAFT_344817, partial [Podospora conica]